MQTFTTSSTSQVRDRCITDSTRAHMSTPTETRGLREEDWRSQIMLASLSKTLSRAVCHCLADYITRLLMSKIWILQRLYSLTSTRRCAPLWWTAFTAHHPHPNRKDTIGDFQVPTPAMKENTCSAFTLLISISGPPKMPIASLALYAKLSNQSN